MQYLEFHPGEREKSNVVVVSLICLFQIYRLRDYETLYGVKDFIQCRALQRTSPSLEGMGRMHGHKSIGYIGLYKSKTILPLHGPSQVFKRCVEEYSPNDPNEDFQEGLGP